MDDLLAEFLTETNESLAGLDNDLVLLEQDPGNTDLLSNVFRLIHTLKGTCGFLDLPRLEAVAHKAEDVLGFFRDGVLAVTPEYMTLVFESIDRIKYIVGELEATGSEPEGDDVDLIGKLEKVISAADGENPHIQNKNLEVELEHDEPEQNGEATFKQEARESQLANMSLRVNVDVLENLMTMVSELVLTRNQLLQILRHQQDSSFSAPLLRLNQVVSDLQEGVMKTRMQPIGNAWSKLPRIVRDICQDLGKKIDLEMNGQDTELDRQVLEMIKDPLTHMIRNSADHGVELPQERVQAGKAETGKIRLNAYHEGGHIIIEISDDGKGLAIDKIKKKALENGVTSEDELAGLDDHQIQQFIFRAGFSTAEKVTSVSGRGVGMDVVRTNIESIGGSIELKSEEGRGTTFYIKIPLTLAIVSALILESAGERFALPQLAVRELVSATENGESRIETIKGSPVFRLRDQLLPLVSLKDLLKIEDFQEDAQDDRNHYIVVTQVGSNMFGIIVDKVFDTEEIVVKPVACLLRDIEMFSGNTILGDGSVIMILDPAGVAKSIGTMKGAESKAEEGNALTQMGQSSLAKTALLIFEAGDMAPKAVPLSLVARLENIQISDIEHSNDEMLVQYRGRLMPLVAYNQKIKMEGENKPVLVFSNEEKNVGLVVDRIVDVCEEHIDVQHSSGQPGVLGSAIICEKATDVIDVGYFIHSIDRDWYKQHDDTPFDAQNENSSKGRKVLVVDDSPFFRNMLTPLLSVAGYEVTTLNSAAEALDALEAGNYYDVIISDIEMPDMNGFEFAKAVRSSEKWKDIPIVALSSHATKQDITRGKEAGFASHVVKFDRDTLLTTLSDTIYKNANGHDEQKVMEA